MNSVCSLLVLLLVPFYLISANETSQSTIAEAADESTENPNEYYEQPQSSEEAYQQYNNFQNAFARQFRLQQEEQQQRQQLVGTPSSIDNATASVAISADEPVELETDALVPEGNVDELVPASTIAVPTEQSPLVIQSSTMSSDASEMAAKLVGELTNASDAMAPIDTNNTDALSSKHAKMYVANEPDDEPVYHALSLTDNTIRKAIAQNNPNLNVSTGDNGTDDYVNDGGDTDSDTNDSQPITLQYYPADTTIASIVPLPIQIQSTTRSAVYAAAASTIVTTSAAPITTTTIPVLPQNLTSSKKTPKKIETSTRIYKYSADEILRKYLEDTYIRAPIASLINTSPEALRKSKILWKAALRPNTPIDIVLLAFNSSGVGVTYAFKNTRTMIAGLESVQESREMMDGGSGFFGIMRACDLVPYDSAIFISTDKTPEDLNMLKYAAITLLKKRIRLYLIWFGGTMSVDENETSDQIGGVLGEVAIRSGGEIFRITEESLGNGDMGLVTHFQQNDIQGAQVLDIPTNSTASNLQTKINRIVDPATLTTPNGVEIRRHAASIRIRRSENRLGRQREDIEWPEDDEDDESIKADIDDFEATPIIPSNGNFTEYTDVTGRSGSNSFHAETRIELGAQSQLLAVAGSTAHIYYEVTNLRMIPTLYNFQVVDEQRFLQTLNPPSMWLPPGQTASAVLTCIIPPNTEIGTKDKITFSSQAQSVVNQAAILTVISANSQGLDRRAPVIWWNYGSRCDGRLSSGQCAGAIWSIELTTVDYDTGLLRVQSNPKGLVIRNVFTAGTREEVKATYSASCCTPRVTITSYDLAGNQRTISVDITEYILGPVEIVAIVLGVILILIILAVIIAAIVYCCKKRKEARELPVYRSRTERERERAT